MLVVHGLFSVERGVGVWAEDPGRPIKSPSQSLRTARAHPFAVPPDSESPSAEAILLLPSVVSAPLDSPELIRESPRRGSKVSATLLPWRIPVNWLDPGDAVRMLTRTSIDPGADADAAADNLRYGASLRYLSAVVSFAGDLVDRGRVLPAIDLQATGGLARWRPVVQGPDLLALHRLAAAMPPVCRAEAQQPDDRAGRDPHTLVSAAVDAFTDVITRRRLAGSDTGAGVDLRPPRRGRSRPTAADAWLAALTAPDARIDAPDDAVDDLADSLAEWDEVGPAGADNARLTIRLQAPGPEQEVAGPDSSDADPVPVDPVAVDAAETGADSGAWRLEFLLQSLEDPSLLVPAEQVWIGDTGLDRWLDRPEELLLTELGRATRIYPAMAPALQQARPADWETDAVGAHHFLAQAAPELDAAGIGLLLPSWWGGRHRLALRLSAGTPVEGVVEGSGGFGRAQLVDFQWQLAIGDEVLSEDELHALADAKSPLVRVRGKWVSADPEQLRRALDFLHRKGSGRMSAGQVIALAARQVTGLDAPVPIDDVAAQGWLGALLSGPSTGPATEIVAVQPSADFRATLRPYQQRGLSYLSFMTGIGLGACLADDMGLGKTIQLLALLTREHADAPGIGPTLLICPMSVVGNWQHESATFAPALRVYVHHGPDRLTGNEFDAMRTETELVVTTYAIATRDGDLLSRFDWRRVVLDEAQTVKNSASRQAVAVRRIPAGHRIALTGTPVENRLAELWAVMDFVNPGLLGTMPEFRTRYAIPVERYGQSEPAQLLRTITRPYLLRRLKTDPTIIDDLPDKIEMKQYCPLTVEQVSLYQAVVDDMMIRIEESDGITRRGNVLAAMAKLKQVCNHPAQFLHDGSALGRRSGKVTRLLQILEEIHAAGEKVLCFTQYTEFAAMLAPLLTETFGREVLYLHGGTPKKRRDEMVARFQGKPVPGQEHAAADPAKTPAIFLLSLKAGGTGLTLTAANHVIHLDRWWNPAVENQATDRAFRIGQQRTVEVHKLICTGTLEERIDKMIEDKKALADSVIGDGESWLTEFSTTQLRELFALTAQADDE